MSKDKKTYRPIGEQELEKYLKGELSPQEAHKLERKALSSNLESEAIEGWGQFDPEDVRHDLIGLRKRLEAREKSPVIWIRIAASVSLLLVSGYLVWNFMENPDQPKQIVETFEEPSAKPEESPQKESTHEIKDVGNKEEDQLALLDETQLDQPKESKPIVKPELVTTESVQEEISLEFEPSEALAENPSDSDIGFFELKDSIQIPILESIVANDVGDGMQTSAPVSPSPGIEQALSGRVAGVSEFRSTKTSSARTSDFSSRTITGVVTDSEGQEPLPGVTVVVVGTTIGTISDLDGKYSINVPASKNVLGFSFIGFEPLQSDLSNSEILNVEMDMDVASLSEVVVVGYGTQSSTGSDINETYSNASPENGMSKFNDYIRENKIYPTLAQENGIKGVVKLRVSISASGEVGEIILKKALGYGCDEEAIRLVREGPRWSPAKMGETQIDSEITIRIKFP